MALYKPNIINKRTNKISYKIAIRASGARFQKNSLVVPEKSRPILGEKL